jgi:uncharacterized membrane protein
MLSTEHNLTRSVETDTEIIRNRTNTVKYLVVPLIGLLILLVAIALLAEEVSLRQRMVHSLAEKGWHPGVVVFVVSMLPIFELRGGIPIGINFYGMQWYYVVPIAITGNMVPVFPILLLLGPLSRLLSRIPLFRRFFDWLFKRTRSRSAVVERYKAIGLMFFVAIPLPVTGAWTGSVAAFIFNIKFRNAIISILLGVFIASVIVTTLSLLGIWGAIIAGVALMAIGIFSLRRSVK